LVFILWWESAAEGTTLERYIGPFLYGVERIIFDVYKLVVLVEGKISSSAMTT
jgi:hypothetical protein